MYYQGCNSRNCESKINTMRTLFHLWLHPFSRKVRIALSEKKLDFDLKIEKVWERRTEFLALNPAGDVPVLVEEDGTTLANSQVICEYIEEVYPEVNLIGVDPVQRAETRRLVTWFDVKFNAEVMYLYYVWYRCGFVVQG